ncbi:DUF1351 domain-containing protein [Furfurilactobacillus milii]|uniref:DUF1351 domain-containing protein n=1 Tax=Furfurilactobacillus milii TaxID=2888272 RepID=A0ABT6DCF7_9LACO|nr:DUF1351 domain-containing protein [Furfurilactobacillus milii]QLE66958.1 hypothetical protein LROSL2_1608 [Furfurilactobacillus rossiae]MCF6161967.1 DUF1351 domain-containing protein [Furfurilactobacillus milii]MCF6164347.1 DUF1351 domain-containing protein [Furfurilactobacillus milii]MDF9914835.1 DUF1351 domain-containing protein [Furfurilactobacillus milii]QLE69388.1 hypothetical protein LROSL3_1609 [Furfurilactobacillus rossiae]
MANEVAEQQAFSVDYKPATISINNEKELKDRVTKSLAKYQNLVITADNVKDAKDARAELNKLDKQINDTKIAIHNKFDEPYNAFNEVIKGLRKQVSDTVEPISAGIKELDEQEREARRQGVLADIKEMAPKYEVKPDDIEFDESWLNKSLSKIKLHEAIAGEMKAVKQRQDQLAEASEAIKKYAAAQDIDSAGFIEQLKLGATQTQIMERIDEEVTRRQRKAEYDKAMSDLANKQVGNKTVSKETGEVVDEKSVAETVSFRLTGSEKDLNDVAGFISEHHDLWIQVLTPREKVEG